MEIKSVVGDYNGYPTLNLVKDNVHITFGIKKAILILESIETIRKFVSDNEKTFVVHLPKSS